MGEENSGGDKKLGRFGLGCAQFRPKDINTQFGSFQAYKDKLGGALAQIAAIQDFQIEASDSLDNFENNFPHPFALLSESDYPDLASSSGLFFEIILKLRIPERAQRDILEVNSDRSWKACGEIMVYFVYAYDTPLMIVYFSDANDGDLKPSAGVRLVREFLQTEMQNNGNCEFALDVLGPTPFHADFTLNESDNLLEGIEWSRVDDRGFDKITVRVPNGLQDFQDLMWHIEEHLLDDVDVFYALTLERNRVSTAWYDCFNAIKKFEAKIKSAAKFRRTLSWLFPAYSTYDLISRIAEFRFINMTAHEAINDRIRSNVFLKSGPLWKDIRIIKKTFPKYDIESLEKLVDFIDRKQAHRQSIVNTIFAAIAGGVAGALVAFLHNAPNQLAFDKPAAYIREVHPHPPKATQPAPQPIQAVQPKIP